MRKLKEGTQPQSVHNDASRHPLYRDLSVLNIECYQNAETKKTLQLQEEDRLKLAILNEIRFQNEITHNVHWKLSNAKDGSIFAQIIITGAFSLSHARRIVESLYLMIRDKDHRMTPAVYESVKKKIPQEPDSYYIVFPFFDYYQIADLHQAHQFYLQSWVHQSAIDERHMIKQIIKQPAKEVTFEETQMRHFAGMLPFLADLIRQDAGITQQNENTQQANAKAQNSSVSAQNNKGKVVHVGPDANNLLKIYTAKRGNSNPEILLKEFLNYFTKYDIRFLCYDQVSYNPFLVGSAIIETWEQLVANALSNTKYAQLSTMNYIIFVNLSEAELMLINKVIDFIFSHADFLQSRNILATHIGRNGKFFGMTCTIATANLDLEKAKTLNFFTKQLDENTSCVFLPLLDLNIFDARALNVMPANLPVEQYNITYEQRATAFAAKIDQTLAEQTKRVAVILNLLLIKPKTEATVSLNAPPQSLSL